MLKTDFVCMLPMEVQKYIYAELVKVVGKTHADRGMYSRLCDLEDIINVNRILERFSYK